MAKFPSREYYYKQINDTTGEEEFIFAGSELTFNRHSPGTYFLNIQQGCTSITRINPAYSEVQYALNIFKDTLSSAISKASEYRPKSPEKITPEESDAWEQSMKMFEKAGFARPRFLNGISINDVCDEALYTFYQHLNKEHRQLLIQRRENQQSNI